MAITNATPPAMTAALGNAGSVQNFQGTTVMAGPLTGPPKQNYQQWWRTQFGNSSHALSVAPTVIKNCFPPGISRMWTWQTSNAPRFRAAGGWSININANSPNNAIPPFFITNHLGGAGVVTRATCNFDMNFYGQTWWTIRFTDMNPPGGTADRKKSKWRGQNILGVTDHIHPGDYSEITWTPETTPHVGDAFTGYVWTWQQNPNNGQSMYNNGGGAVGLYFIS